MSENSTGLTDEEIAALKEAADDAITFYDGDWRADLDQDRGTRTTVAEWHGPRWHSDVLDLEDEECEGKPFGWHGWDVRSAVCTYVAAAQPRTTLRLLSELTLLRQKLKDAERARQAQTFRQIVLDAVRAETVPDEFRDRVRHHPFVARIMPDYQKMRDWATREAIKADAARIEQARLSGFREGMTAAAVFVGKRAHMSEMQDAETTTATTLRFLEAGLQEKARSLSPPPIASAPTDEWAHVVAKDASSRASENCSLPDRHVAPQLLYAPILFAIQDGLRALQEKKDNA